MESAALSARGEGPAAIVSPATEGLLRMIFGALTGAEDTIRDGRNVIIELGSPISRIDAGGPIYPPEVQQVDTKSKFDEPNREPSLIEKLQIIYERIGALNASAQHNSEIARNAVERLNAAV